MKKILNTTLALLLIYLFGYLIWESKGDKLLAYSENLYSKIKIFTSILETIQRVYIEEKEPDELVEDAIKGMISELDPHTSYLSAEDFKEWNQNFEGYSGIGLSFDIIRKKITVMSVIESGPAAKVGIHQGDKIVEIEGQSVIGIKRDEASKKLMGAVGSSVKINVQRDGWTKPKEFVIIRDRIILHSIPQTLMIQPGIGYIKIERFTATTSTELEQALNLLKSKGMNKLILDLRGNSGGYLNAAIEVTDKFIPGGQKIVYTKGRLSSTYQEYYATSEPTYPLIPLIVLIDHGSASASEIVAGAIQDLDRGLLVGKTSFGKGLVQSQYRFHDGSALLITTAKYYTPSGRPIQRDYFAKSKDEYYREAYNDQLRNIENNIKEKPAYQTRSGRLVYGDGGITPDIWIESEENILSENLRKLYFSNHRPFYTFAEDLVKKNPYIKSNMIDFINHFVVTDKMYNDFISAVKKTDLDFHKINFTKDKNNIKFLIKRELAYLLWGREARFRVNILRDTQLQEAMKYFPKANDLLTMAHLIGSINKRKN
ncbi:MAG: S41 family peptidase [bacterium]